MSATDSTTLRLERTFDAPAQDVFDAWTNPEVLRRWLVIQSSASSSACSAMRSRCVRPSTTRTIAPASSSTFRCLLIAGLDTPKSRVASPTLSSPVVRRSTMPRRIGCEHAENVRSRALLLAIWLTVSRAARPREPPFARPGC